MPTTVAAPVDSSPAKTGPTRDTSGRWLPGQSANPSGRSSDAQEFRARCRQWAKEKGFAILAELAGKSGRDQTKATELLMAYGLGKPTQAVEHSGSIGTDTGILDDLGMTVDEIRHVLQIRRQRIAEAESAQPQESVAPTAVPIAVPAE